jgi:hypothetical protein
VEVGVDFDGGVGVQGRVDNGFNDTELHTMFSKEGRVV